MSSLKQQNMLALPPQKVQAIKYRMKAQLKWRHSLRNTFKNYLIERFTFFLKHGMIVWNLRGGDVYDR